MNVLQQSDIDYQKQLRQIACKVDSHIVNNPVELHNFRNSIKPLAKRWKDYLQAGLEREQALLEHWELVKKNPKLQDKNNKSFEKKGYEWDRFYLFSLDSFGSNPINEMPAKYAPDVMDSLGKYLERSKKNLQKFRKNSKEYKRLSEYRRLQETIKKQRQNLEDIRSEYDTLSPAGQKTAWIKTPPKTVIPNKTYVKFTWWKYLNLDDELVFGCWRPKLEPLPENPLDRLKPTDEEYHSKQRELQTLPRARDEAEEYERYYIFLSSVHDKYLTEVESIIENIWSDDLKDAVWRLCEISFGDKTAFLNSALERVKAKKPAETESQGKKGQSKTDEATAYTNFSRVIEKLETLEEDAKCEGFERHKGIPAKIIKSTPQNMADGFKSRAKIITEKVNTFAYQQDDPELKRLYITYRLSIEGKVRSAKKHLNIDLPGPPKLIGNDYFGGMIHLADWCRDCEAILRDKINDTEPNPELLMCFDELELHFDKDKRTIRRLAQKHNLKEYPDPGNRNRIRIYLPDIGKIPEHDRLKTRDYESKQKLLDKRKAKKTKKK